MKKINLLIPVIAVSTAIPMITTITSCGHSSTYTFNFTGIGCTINDQPEYSQEIDKDEINVKFTVVLYPGYHFEEQSLPKGVSFELKANSAIVTIAKMDKNYDLTIKAKMFGADKPLTFEATAAGQFSIIDDRDGNVPDDEYLPVVKYSVNGGDIHEYRVQLPEEANEIEYISFAAGDTFQFWSDNPNGFSHAYDEEYNSYVDNYFSFQGNGDATCGYISGNIMSLISSKDFENIIEIPSTNFACFEDLFYESDITSAQDLILPAISVSHSCYYQMFYSCNKLIYSPKILPAYILDKDCYAYMFCRCSSMIIAPRLPALKLAESCYQFMYGDCDSLVVAPELPATQLSYRCYSYMFSSCNSLVVAPELPARELAPSCYIGMFDSCFSLVVAPEIPVTTLTDNCYTSMFANCISLIVAPELPATTLVKSCYSNMFYHCTNLIATPHLTIKEFDVSCCYDMFAYCEKLRIIEQSPSSNENKLILDLSQYQPSDIPEYAFNGMFRNCYSQGYFTGTPQAGNKYYFEVQ